MPDNGALFFICNNTLTCTNQTFSLSHQKLAFFLLMVQWNLSKPNLIGTSHCVLNRQVVVIYRLNWQRCSTLGLYLKFCLCRILLYSGFSLDRFHSQNNRYLEIGYTCKLFQPIIRSKQFCLFFTLIVRKFFEVRSSVHWTSTHQASTVKNKALYNMCSI